MASLFHSFHGEEEEQNEQQEEDPGWIVGSVSKPRAFFVFALPVCSAEKGGKDGRRIIILISNSTVLTCGRWASTAQSSLHYALHKRTIRTIW